jgi:nitrate reductase beta subunit
MGVLLYDADKIEEVVHAPDDELLDAQLDALLDPFDPKVIAEAKAAGIGDDWIDSAQRSPAWKFVKEWGLALPLHPEYRTAAMMFYIPPLSPVMSTIERNLARLDIGSEEHDFELFDQLDKARLPLKYLANLFSMGDEERIAGILRKMLAVRLYKRRQSVEGTIDDATIAAMADAGTTPEEAEAIYKLTTLPTMEERFVLPPYHREMAIESLNDPLAHKGQVGVGYLTPPRRGA